MAQGWRGSYSRYKEFFLNISELYRKKAGVRAFLEIMLSISTITIFILLALKPTVTTIIDLLQQINEKKIVLAGLTQKVTDLATADRLLQKNKQFIPDIDTAVSSIPVPDIFAGQVLGLAAKDSVEILGVSINQINLVGDAVEAKKSSTKPLPGNAHEMSFSINIRGTYPNLDAFIKDFENLRIATQVDSLGINSSLTDKGLVIVAVVSGRAPYLGTKI